MKFDDICAQFTRYGGAPDPSILAVLETLADINDDLMNARDSSLVRRGVESVKADLDALVREYRG